MKFHKSIFYVLALTVCLNFQSCKEASTDSSNMVKEDMSKDKMTKMPSEVIPFMDKFKIMLGDGSKIKDIVNYESKDFFYTVNDGQDWVVYKTPNSGVTSKNSSNTRTELHEVKEWIPSEGGNLTGTCKVMHVSETGDARVAASYSVVVGQIHGGEGHENEPIKIYYKKFPGQEKGSVFWLSLIHI